MSKAEELAHVETALKFVSWYDCKNWRDYIITLDMELGVYFGWPICE